MGSNLLRLLACSVLAMLTVSCATSPAAEPSAEPSPVVKSTPTAAKTPRPVQPTATPTPTPRVTPSPNPPGFDGSLTRVRGDLRREVRERNWHPGCPVPIDDLRVLIVDYRGFDGEVHSGPLVVNERVAQDVLGVFRRLYRAHFQIKHIALARKYRPNAHRYDDTRDVTASFNCRPVTDIPGSVSQHSYGWAIDINPIENPYVRGDGSVLRKVAKPYRDRSLHKPGMIHPGDVVTSSFARIGWGWGGDWHTIKDYMHFSLTGR